MLEVCGSVLSQAQCCLKRVYGQEELVDQCAFQKLQVKQQTDECSCGPWTAWHLGAILEMLPEVGPGERVATIQARLNSLQYPAVPMLLTGMRYFLAHIKKGGLVLADGAPVALQQQMHGTSSCTSDLVAPLVQHTALISTAHRSGK